jgi:eukaryotic-like serine/threonine-protein kinase
MSRSTAMARPHFDKRDDDFVGSTIAERYRVDALLDQGAMGRVYSATHVAMRKRVALKVLRAELTQLPEVMERFAREARAAAHINHPHVAAATDFGELPNGAVFLVLEFVEGITLRSVVEQGALPLRRALSIVRQIASALQAAHALSIVHRDLKPENVMLVTSDSGEDFVKVLDFGVAKVPIDFTGNPDASIAQGTQITKAGMVFGTPDYMAIEQALGHDVDGRADLYSLGVIAFELITGRRPFRSNHEFGVIGQQLTGKAPTMKQRAPWISVPREVEHLISRLLQTDVTRRVASAQQVFEELTELLTSLPLDWPDPGVPTAAELDAADAELVSRDEAAGSSDVAPASRRTGLGALHARLPEPMNLLPLWVYISVAVVFVLGGFGIVAGFVAAQDDEKAKQAELRERDLRFGVGGLSSFAPSDAMLAKTPSTPGAVSATLQEALNALSEQQRERLTELGEGLELGESALDNIAEAHPADGWLRVQIARCYMPGGNNLLLTKAGKDGGTGNAQLAFRWVSEGVRLDPALIGDRFVAGVLWYTAQHTDTREATFKLLSGEMLAAGADIIYDLAITPGVPAAVADNARLWLGTSDFRVAASVEANVAALLVSAQSCDALVALLPRAVQQGDGRSLSFLQTLDIEKYCAAGASCKLCVDDGLALTDARNQLAARLGAK